MLIFVKKHNILYITRRMPCQNSKSYCILATLPFTQLLIVLLQQLHLYYYCITATTESIFYDCLFICLPVSRITRKVFKRFSWNGCKNMYYCRGKSFAIFIPGLWFKHCWRSILTPTLPWGRISKTVELLPVTDFMGAEGASCPSTPCELRWRP